MKNTLLILALLLSLSVFSQQQRKFAVLPECENAEDPKLCLEEKLQKEVFSLFSPAVKDTLIARAGKPFFVISINFLSGKNGKIDPNWLLVGTSYKELSKIIKKHVLSLPAFLPEVDENGDSFTTQHRLSLIYKIDSAQNEILIPTAEETEQADLDFPFAVIEDVPIFPGCQYVDKKQRRACFQKKIQEHIRLNFRYPRKAVREKISGRVSIFFMIDKEGKVSNIVTRGPHEILEKEAVRIIKKLPDMLQPGKQKGRAVNVPFSIPITFKL